MDRFAGCCPKKTREPKQPTGTKSLAKWRKGPEKQGVFQGKELTVHFFDIASSSQCTNCDDSNQSGCKKWMRIISGLEMMFTFWQYWTSNSGSVAWELSWFTPRKAESRNSVKCKQKTPKRWCWNNGSQC